jgi:hypothetical protein
LAAVGHDGGLTESASSLCDQLTRSAFAIDCKGEAFE